MSVQSSEKRIYVIVLAFLMAGCAARKNPTDFPSVLYQSGDYTAGGCVIRWTGITWLVSLGQAQGPGGKCNVTDEPPKWVRRPNENLLADSSQKFPYRGEWRCRRWYELGHMVGNDFVEAHLSDRYDRNAVLICRKYF